MMIKKLLLVTIIISISFIKGFSQIPLSPTQIEGAYFVNNTNHSFFLANSGIFDAFRIQISKGNYYLYFHLFGKKEKTLLKKIAPNTFIYMDKDNKPYYLNLNNYTIKPSDILFSNDVNFRIFHREAKTIKTVESIPLNKDKIIIAILISKIINSQKKKKINIYYEIIYNDQLKCHKQDILDNISNKKYPCHIKFDKYSLDLNGKYPKIVYSFKKNNVILITKKNKFKEVINEFKIW